jgi:hypothetical protein
MYSSWLNPAQLKGEPHSKSKKPESQNNILSNRAFDANKKVSVGVFAS